MGRRDEPELEELSKLLRRLETMDVGSKHESARKIEPEPPSEYVGALRGAAPAKTTTNWRDTSLDSVDINARGGHQQPQKAASSTNAMIIGAATAAVVSSLVAATVVLWTSGGKRSEDASRLTFYATKRTDTPAPVVDTNTNSRPSPEDAQRLLQRADTYLRSGKPADARIVLEQAARAGSGVAALTLGAMYDPARVAQFANLGIAADPAVARAWYERAKDLGVAEANDRLAELAAR